MTTATILEDWDVLVVPEKGLYIRGEADPWLIMGHEDLMERDNELSRVYREAI